MLAIGIGISSSMFVAAGSVLRSCRRKYNPKLWLACYLSFDTFVHGNNMMAIIEGYLAQNNITMKSYMHRSDINGAITL